MSADHLLIVGAGDCGTRAALRVRELDPDIRITLIGEEHSEPYERPALSKAFLTDDVEPTVIASRDVLADRGVEWRPGVAAVRVDPDARSVELADGSSVRYDRLLLTTGSRARRLAVPGAEHAPTLRSIEDAHHLRSRLEVGVRLLVVGGGFIGLEVAASARRLGAEVTVVEFAHQLMSRVVPTAIGKAIGERHVAEGVTLRLGVGIDRLTTSTWTTTAHLDDGTEVDGAIVVAGVGAVPNTELAASAGLPISNGIAVDEHLRTADPRIFAAGDCCSVPHPLYGGARIRLEAWRNALAQADIAAHNLLGEQVSFDVVPSFWSDQYDLTMQVVGLHAAAVGEIVRRRDDGHEIRFGVDESGRIVSASGLAPGTELARDLRLAEILIAERAAPDAADLSDPSVALRSIA